MSDRASTIDPNAPLRSFGRRRGRKLSSRQDALFRELLPQIAVNPAEPVSHLSTARPLWLEIGFGGGEHLVWQAENNPHVHLIGCEPFEDGVVKVLTAITDRHLKNISIHADDVRQILFNLPPSSLSRVFILFPDPWPKRKHLKRRLINRALLKALARAMRPGAELRIGTDIHDYARWILIAFQASPEFVWTAKGPRDWQVRPADWPETRYEQKAMREGRRSCYLTYKRASAPTECPNALALEHAT